LFKILNPIIKKITDRIMPVAKYHKENEAFEPPTPNKGGKLPRNVIENEVLLKS